MVIKGDLVLIPPVNLLWKSKQILETFHLATFKRILIRQPCIQDEPTRMFSLLHLAVSLAVTGSDNVWPIPAVKKRKRSAVPSNATFVFGGKQVTIVTLAVFWKKNKIKNKHLKFKCVHYQYMLIINFTLLPAISGQSSNFLNFPGEVFTYTSHSTAKTTTQNAICFYLAGTNFTDGWTIAWVGWDVEIPMLILKSK